MSKKNNKSMHIFMESLKLYFSNIDKFLKYMTFPVLGQLAGLLIVFFCVYFYSKNIPVLIQKFPSLNNFDTLMLTALFLTLPGLIIFTKAFWEYLVAYGAINSMLENMLKSGKVYDFDAHTELIKRRTLSFVALWLLFGIFSLLAIVPLFWIICGVLTIFFVLIFQVFTYEPEQSPLGCVKRSFNLVKGHFATTFMLFALIGALTYYLIPSVANFILEVLNVNNFLIEAVLPFVNLLPLDEINSLRANVFLQPLQPNDIALSIVSIFVFQIFIQYTLPMRSILWGMWYKELNGGKLYVSKEDKPRKKNSKKPSEKLMESSRKKYSSKKLDRNILKRAMEKDED